MTFGSVCEKVGWCGVGEDMTFRPYNKSRNRLTMGDAVVGGKNMEDSPKQSEHMSTPLTNRLGFSKCLTSVYAQ